MDFNVDLNDVVDEVLDLNKKLTLENILLQRTLVKAAQEVERLKTELAGAQDTLTRVGAVSRAQAETMADNMVDNTGFEAPHERAMDTGALGQIPAELEVPAGLIFPKDPYER